MAHLLDNALAGADGVSIVKLMLRKVELGYFSSVLNLVDRSLKLGLADGHERVSRLGEGYGKGITEGCARATEA